MGLIAIDKYDEVEQNGIFSYILIFFSVLIMSSFLTAAAIRLFQDDDTGSMQVSPLVSPLVKASPLGVAISEAAVRPFATDTLTPYQEQLREAAVLDSKVGSPASGSNTESDSNKDSVPEEISRPKAESRVAETHVERNKPGLGTVRRNKVLLAGVAAHPAPSVALKPVDVAPIAEAADKTVGTISEKSAAAQPAGNSPASSIAPVQEGAKSLTSGKSPESTLVASIYPAQASTALPVADKTAKNVSAPAAEKKNSVPYSSSLNSPFVSSSATDAEIKTTTGETAAAADISKEDGAQQADNKADKKDKGTSFMTILGWTLKIVGLALVFLK